MTENITADSMFISNGIHIEATRKGDVRIMCNWCTVTEEF